ncbi:MAG TPA: energy-coupling factor transporter transmembrane component T [Roseiflexaceae bacterium]|nr:energy-coupling factor transporter transmembrane component T [Roseiflexaceae bacterium]
MAVEFSRNITFGQYLDLGSPIHRLDPRAKQLATGALMLAVLLTRTFGGVAVVFVAALLIQRLSRVPLAYLLRGMRALVFTMLVIAAFQILFYPATPEEALWRWGVLSLSWAGVLQALLTFCRVVLLYYLVNTLLFVTPLMDLADGTEIMLEPLKRLRVPVNELVMTMVVALKFVPLLVAELERLVKAQAARGVRFDQGGPLVRARRLGAVLIPLFVGALSRAEVLTIAMEARCYRGGAPAGAPPRTKRRTLTFRRADMAALALAFAFAAAAVTVSRGLGI